MARTMNTNTNFEDNVKSKETIMAEPLTDFSELQINIVETKADEKYIDIRTWYCTRFNPTMKPGKGLWLPLQAADMIRDALNEYLARETHSTQGGQ